MVDCPACRKHLPSGVRFCAYCGTAVPFHLPWPVRRPARPVPVASGPAPRPLPAPARPWGLRQSQWLMGAAGGLLGAGVGGLLGVILGEGWVGAVIGGLGVGAGALLGEGLAGPIPDRRSAERFGILLGGLGGVLALQVGVLVVLLVTAWTGGWEGLRTLWALLRANFNLAFMGPAVGALAGTGLGALSGYYLGRGGYNLGRRGAIAGAALAWMLAAALAGFITGDYIGQTLGAARVEAALVGIVVQVGGGALLLAAVRRGLGRWRNWWVRRP